MTTIPIPEDKYFTREGQFRDDLMHPEDIAAENEYEFVGLFVRVSLELERVTTHNTELFANVDPLSDQEKRLSKLVLPYESRLERWLDQAQCYLPEWHFNGGQAQS